MRQFLRENLEEFKRESERKRLIKKIKLKNQEILFEIFSKEENVF